MIKNPVTTPLQDEASLETSFPLLNSQGKWFRFSAYEIVQKDKAFYYIRSAKNATIEYYRPFEQLPKTKILEDLLKIAERLYNISNERDVNDPWTKQSKQLEEQAELIRWFTQRYGPLGIFYDLISTYFRDSNLNLVVALHKPHDKSVMPLADYLDFFFPQKKPNIVEWRQCYEESFLRGYAEETSSATSQLVELYQHFQWFENKEPWHSTLNVYPVGIAVSREGNDFKHDFTFPSLLRALNLILLKNYTEVKQPLRRCLFPNCVWFIASRRDRVYCDTHKDDSTLRVQRKRQKDAQTIAPKGVNKRKSKVRKK